METIVQDNSGRKKKIILISLGVLATGVAGYFGYEWWQKRKAEKEDSGDTTDTLPPPPDKKVFHTTTSSGSGSGSSGNDEFPLKKGSKGSKVKSLQRALIGKFGKSILPKYGADGDFGNETASGLKRAGLPTEVDQSTYDSLVSGVGISAGSSLDAAGIAKTLYDAATAGTVSAMLPGLKQMNSTDDYTAVNREFENNYTIGGVRKTLVNGLLSALSDENDKAQVRLEFSRMGLKYNGSKWSLSGIVGSVPIITTEDTYVWASPKEAVKVPEKMVLGNEIEERGGYTLFENSGKHYLVKTKSIKTL